MRTSVRRPVRAALITTVIGAALLVAGASPATAVPVRPTDMRSTVTSVEPVGPLSVGILGGDALVDLRVEPGHEVIVEGYDREPYLRVSNDGTVAVNRRSPAAYLNQNRDAIGTVPADASTAAAPDWQPIGSGGRAIWHDHRIHVGAASGPVQWAIPLTVDGRDTLVHGELRHLDPPSPVPWLGLTVVVAAAAWYTGRRRPRRGAVVAAVTASALAAAAGFLEWSSIPAVAGRNAGLIALPLASAVLVGVGSLVGSTARRPAIGLVSTLAAVSLLAGWLAFRWSILTRAVLVSTLAPVLDRGALAVVAGLAIAAAGLSVAGAGSDAAAVRGPRPARRANPASPASPAGGSA